jgi:hypothetical protein
MSILADVLLVLFEAGFESSSERRLVATCTTGSVVLSIGTVMLLTTSADQLSQTGWGLVALGSVICGSAGLLLSALHVRRNEEERVFGLACLALNLVAVAIPTAWMITH